MQMKLQVAHVLVHSRGIEEAQGRALRNVETLRKDDYDSRKLHLQEGLIDKRIVLNHFP